MAFGSMQGLRCASYLLLRRNFVRGRGEGSSGVEGPITLSQHLRHPFSRRSAKAQHNNTDFLTNARTTPELSTCERLSCALESAS